jgi:GH35 family endo-1,4-beta-xylanase
MKSTFCIHFVLVVLMFSCKSNSDQTIADKVKEDTNWKKEALHRIDSLRKRELTIIVKDKNGNTIPNAEVKINLEKHEFKFGAAIDKDVFNSPHTAKYKSLLKTYFNSSGFENALKPKRRFSEAESKAAQIIPWFIKNDFYMRGHALVWENRKNMRPEEKKLN